MGLLSNIISRLFTRAPKYNVSAYGTLYSAVVARLEREGVTVGGTARLPRIEVHTITENEALDKEGCVRQISLTVECLSNRSMSECVGMNDTNIRLLTEYVLDLGEGWQCLGVIPAQLQDLTETADAQSIVYRLIQQFVIFAELQKSAPTEEEETPAEGDTDNDISDQV